MGGHLAPTVSSKYRKLLTPNQWVVPILFTINSSAFGSGLSNYVNERQQGESWKIFHGGDSKYDVEENCFC